uniref:Uncharacterized protein n=1 Tax=Siphoviridae sp. ctYcY12 TaxID=2825550 RepID=A0A8S5TU06_9CAUD|nr:MAG TPA: hypothetical protein [Siphoviridae sp. ctYcY12]
MARTNCSSQDSKMHGRRLALRGVFLMYKMKSDT